MQNINKLSSKDGYSLLTHLNKSVHYIFKKILNMLFLYIFITIILSNYMVINAQIINCPRLVSTSPEITEIIYELHAEKCLVGVDINSNFPLEATKLPKISDYYNINQEKIVELKTDLILFSSEYNSLVQSRNKLLQDKFVSFKLTSIEDLKKSIIELAKITHREHEAQILVSGINDKILSQTLLFKNKSYINTIILLWQKPYMVAGSNTILNDYIHICHGFNPYTKINIPYQMVDMENIISKQADLIIVMTNEVFNIPNIKTSYISGEDRDILSRATPRSVFLGIERLCTIIDSSRAIK